MALACDIVAAGEHELGLACEVAPAMDLEACVECGGKDLAPVPFSMPLHRPPALADRRPIVVDNLSEQWITDLNVHHHAQPDRWPEQQSSDLTSHQDKLKASSVTRTHETAGQEPFAAGSRIAMHST
ncbi:hypothetical protein [Streptomyces murinus]|uniref:hypothetical protein n=1 Tax=Streptomyces murinus TaxID=33900 RepID=UPI0037FAD7AE